MADEGYNLAADLEYQLCEIHEDCGKSFYDCQCWRNE